MNTLSKIGVVVGGTAGIGLETARLLTQKGYRLIIIGRNAAAGKELVTTLSHTSFVQADMSLMSEVRRAALLVANQVTHIDLLLHTADVLGLKRMETPEGNELAFATNYLSRFLFNELLKPLLSQSSAPRIVHVAAAGMPIALSVKNFPPAADINSFSGHNLGQAANDFYGLQLREQWGLDKLQVNILNPGLVDTNIRKKGKGGFWMKAIMNTMEFLLAPLNVKPEIYAQLVVKIATGEHPAANQHVLIDRKGRAMVPRKDRLDAKLRTYVWKTTEDLVELKKANQPI